MIALGEAKQVGVLLNQELAGTKIAHAAANALMSNAQVRRESLVIAPLDSLAKVACRS